jgi:membrane protein insertase, YidC/Oxa1 family, C-terminal domain
MILTKATGIIMGPISTLMGWIFNFIYNLFYGLNIYSVGFSIIVFTIIVRILIFPLSLKMTRSSKVQQFLQPEFNKITKKYKGKKDQESMFNQQREMAELRSKYGLKTSSGCLTTLIQFPIMISLYNVINNAPAYVTKIRAMYQPIADAIFGSENGHTLLQEFITNNSKSFSRVVSIAKSGLPDFSTVTDAASEVGKNALNTIIDVLAKCNDTLFSQLGEKFSSNPEVGQAIANNEGVINQVNNFFGINLSEAPGLRLTWALTIPIASFIFQYLSMKVMPIQKTGDEQQDQMAETMRKSMMFMPLMSFGFTIIAPAGLGLYWATSALVGMIITILTNKYYEKADMEKIVAKMQEKAEAKLAKKGGKKSFMERMMDNAYGKSESEAAEHARGMNKYGSTSLKNYTSPTAYKNENQSSDSEDRTDTGKKYKAGSISARANSVRDYNNKN